MKSPWKKLPVAGRVALVVGLVVGAVAVVTAARRDLGDRDPTGVRGNPRVWNTVTRSPGGAAAYLIFGRRPQEEHRLVG